ncbi:MAG: 16S rRNA (cytosine(967)-C(5))-methyltransferase RsmB [Lachnospiraceae bacterium]|nr:16S rRNA (cytosine(967)-C(5))-methyltransferase RsmB [Lachnospiraceae bacterium]
MEILEKKQYSHYVMKQVLDKYGYLDKQERSFIKRVTEGTVERCLEMDYIINSFSKVPVKKMKPLIRSLMRMSVYQLLYMDSIPDSAVCNEAVKLANKRGFSPLKGFVNGVLRNIARNKEKIEYPDREKEPVSYLSVVYSMPEWIVEMWLSRFGGEKTEQILKGLLSGRPVTIRLEEGLSSKEKEELLQKITCEGIETEQVQGLPYAYRLKNLDRVETIPGFAEGLVMIQDAGSMEIIELADIKEDQYIIDVCGAPGGKALHAAGKMKNTGFVTVRDISQRKVELMEDNIARSGYGNIKAEVFDATVLDEENVEKADVVIADLPCSGLGVIGRKGDIKYRVTKEDVINIAALQQKILSVVWQYVKPGGKLIYSTCTLTEEENEKNTAWFLEQFPFHKEKEKTLIPGIQETDGFYMAVLRRDRS